MDSLGITPEEVSFEQARHTGEPGSSVPDSGALMSAESSIIRELGAAEQAFGPDNVQLLDPLARLAALRIARGDAEQAAPIVLRALDIGDRYPQDRPELVILLTDLTRLSMKQSAYSLAEPLLLRLLEMKRAKGEDHPEVATVLASLAAVRQGVGQHESAEQLWRRVLEIREKTLAPNHFAVATAIERLADSCAARGKIEEALQLFKRAYAMRELTLGPAHASLRFSRERIADLELQSSEELFEGADTSALAPAISVLPAPYATQRSRPAPVEVPVASKPSLAPEYVAANTMIATRPVTALTDFVAPGSLATQTPTSPAPYRDLVLSIERDLEDEEGEGKPNPFAAVVTAMNAFISDRRKVAAVAMGGTVFLLLALAADSRAGTELTTADGSTTSASASPATGTAAAVAVAAPAAIVSAPRQPAESIRSAIAGLISSSRSKAETKAEKKAEERAATPAKVAIPRVSQSVLARADSVARSIKTPQAAVGDAIAVQPLAVGTRTRLWNPEGETSTAPTRARLIGNLPTPRLPDQLNDIQGVLKIWVRIDTTGRPVMSTFNIESTPNSLLNSSARQIVEDLRFEPARSAGPNPRRMADSVEISFNFTRK